jgi:dipeptidyl aminopeptidase/acylaminoacyl peptidase
MKRILAAAVALVMLCAADAPPQGYDAAAAFGAREAIANASLSPDGTKLAFIAPTKGQGATLYTVATTLGAEPRAALTVSGNPERLQRCNWVSNERLVCKIYGVIGNGIEILPFDRVYAVNADGSNQRQLSTRQNDNSERLSLYGGSVVDWLPEDDNAVLMSRDYVPESRIGSLVEKKRDGLGVDRVDTRTLAVSRIEQPRPNAVEYISDGRGDVRIVGFAGVLGATQNSSGKIYYSYRTRGSRDWQTLGTFDSVAQTGFSPYAVDHDRNVAYGLMKKDGRWAAYEMKLDGTLATSLIYARSDVDVSGFYFIGRRNRVVGVTYSTATPHVEYFDEALQKLTASLAKALPGHPAVDVVDSSLDENRLLIWAGSDVDPGAYYLFDRGTRQLAKLIDARPQLDGHKLGAMKAISYRAADGTMVPAYLTLPPGGDGKNLPAIVMPHGGPSARDEWGFDWLSQYYAARGYAVIQPQFRGSAGYGDQWFKDNGFKSWRIAIGDVLDAGRWLVTEGVADPKRLAIVGWSYGGYAALQSAVIDPGLFKAVVAIAPVTDLASLKAESLNWSNHRIVSDYIGDGPHIREGSPAQNAERIKAPVLLFHAALDSNVRIEESRLMDAKLKAAGAVHELVTWDKLDHYLDDSDARALMLRKSDVFLRSSMGM